jgi:UDP-glucose 4-epimerase
MVCGADPSRTLVEVGGMTSLPMRIVVTGAAGFIGSHSVEALVSAGHKVLALDDLSAGHLENLVAVRDSIEFERVDIRERARLQRLFVAWKPDAVLHLAARVSVPQSVSDPLETASVNLTGSLEILEAARLSATRRIVVASSAAVYGVRPRLPCRETDMPAPASPYAAQKLSIEHNLAAYGRVYGMQTIALRYFNVYGARQDPTSPYAGVIAKLHDCLINGHAFSVHGDGGQTRDFISVMDVADVNRRLLERDAPATLLLNVGTGRSASVMDLVQVMSLAMDRELELQHTPECAGDVRYSRASIACLRQILGRFHPRSLRLGVTEAFG